ncbi:DUF2628 domain-containing protein [Cohnella cellulosilytica]|uniref:DUF2628 domain-containing protein n=1 Tax=Cohnella cellulosilytica TaxID=986710 RepID=UPI0035E7461D
MFCTQCGKEMPDNARFCGACGAEFSDRGEERPAVAEDSGPPSDPDEETKVFVGRNADYYLRKWGKSVVPEKAISWNWAAFFLAFFWLGYRKQYGVIFFIVGLWLAIDVVDLTADLELNDSSVGMALSMGFGLGGNALYYKYANKQIGKINRDFPDRPAKLKALADKGGTSRGGVFLSIGLVVAYVVIYFFILFPILGKTEVEFGRSVSDGIIGERTSVFNERDSIHYMFEFPGSGGDVEVVLESRGGSVNGVVERWPLDVPSDWPGVSHNFGAPEAGEYILKVFKGDRVISKGEFTVKN